MGVKKTATPTKRVVFLFGAAGGILHDRTQYATGILLPKTLRRWFAFLEVDFESLFFMRPKK